MAVRMRAHTGLRPGPAARLLFRMHAKLRRRDARPQDARSRYAAVLDRQTAERGPQIVDWQPEIQERAQYHVAGGARKAVEVESLGHSAQYM